MKPAVLKSGLNKAKKQSVNRVTSKGMEAWKVICLLSSKEKVKEEKAKTEEEKAKTEEEAEPSSMATATSVGSTVIELLTAGLRMKRNESRKVVAKEMLLKCWEKAILGEKGMGTREAKAVEKVGTMAARMEEAKAGAEKECMDASPTLRETAPGVWP